MSNWDTVAAMVTIVAFLVGAFDYIVIKPLQKSIDVNSNVLDELKRELERSAIDRRSLDARVSALEEAHSINKERITHMEEVWDNLKGK